MLRIAICDDDKYICKQLNIMLIELGESLSRKFEIEVFISGESLLKYLSKEDYFNIIFLDIELENLNGVEIGRIIREKLNDEITEIIYISGNDSYAMSLFDIRPFHFLIKPLQKKKIEKVLRKVIKLVNKGNQFFEYKIGHTRYKVPIKDILYFESEGKKVNMTLQNQKHEFYSKLVDIKRQLENQDFIHIHKSYLVNNFYVVEYQYDSVKMSDKTILPISQQHRKFVRNQLLQKKQEGNN